jgi:hypothetical protein
VASESLLSQVPYNIQEGFRRRVADLGGPGAILVVQTDSRFRSRSPT